MDINLQNIYSGNNKLGKLHQVLNTPVNKDWVIKHEIHKEYNYLPIDKVLILLNGIWGTQWRKEILTELITTKFVKVILRVHYFDFDKSEWTFQDGGAVCEISAMHPEKAAISVAISDAIKDAMGVFPLFGSELNIYVPKIGNIKPEKWQNLKLQFEKMGEFLPSEHYDPIKNIIDNEIEAKRIQITQTLNQYDPEKPKRKAKVGTIKKSTV